jgi:hypothetical protein
MRTAKLTATLTPVMTALAMIALTLVNGAFASNPATGAGKGREVIKIVNTVPGPRHGHVIATGAFDDHGYFLRKKASLVFTKGRLAVRRHLLSTVYSPPDLATCWFKIRQSGTFRVFYATGKYRGLRYGGRFSTTISGRLKRTGHDECGSQIVFYRTVTYEIGYVP